MEESEYGKLIADARAYLSNRYALLRLELLDKLSRIIGLVVFALVMALLLFTLLAFLGLSAVYALAEVVPVWLSCLILAALFGVLVVLVCCFKKRWFVNPIVRALSGILYAEDETEKEGGKND